jgi:hypothetical protein
MESELIHEAWKLYNACQSQPFLVKPSIPILFFGDSKKYFNSQLKVISLGLNPSRIEFPEEDRFLRFDGAQPICLKARNGVFSAAYLESLNGYFRRNPYKPWFNSFEALLNGLDCSYYGNTVNTALHTDLCSPLATDPTWSNLPNEAKSYLSESGTPLWHSLVDWLAPDVIIASVARAHLDKISFSRQNEWKVIYTVERKNPYQVQMAKMCLPQGKPTYLVFGKAANTPFGTVSNAAKREIGRAIKDKVYGR